MPDMLEERARLYGDFTYRAAIFDETHAGIAVVDAKGAIVSANARWQESAPDCRSVEGSRDVGRNYFDFCRDCVSESDGRAARAGIQEVIDGTRDYFYRECIVPQSNSAERWLALSVTPLLDRPNLFAVAHEDITERVSRERNRLRALVHSGLLHSIPAGEFDDLVAQARTTLMMPMATFSLLDERKLIFYSCAGSSITELARSSSFCAHTICDDRPLVIGDALKDPRFHRSALVIRDPRVRFYAGVPLHLSTGEAVGSLCVIDFYPRSFSESDLSLLREIGDRVEHRLQALEHH
jgi:GAF domain-containing protein